MNSWASLLRVVVKAAVLFGLVNVAFAAVSPLEGMGRLSLYNRVLPGRVRLPYGENPAESYNLSLDNVPAMFASHVISRPKELDEFRVVVIGDSAAWGWLLPAEETLVGQLNAAGYMSEDDRPVLFYNLAYPIMSVTKDLVLLDEAMGYEPDMVVWLVTLESLPRPKQLDSPLLQQNPARVGRLIEQYSLALNPADERFVEPDWFGRTIVGQRRPLADWLRLQLYGFSWAATEIDIALPDEISLRESDFEEDVSWQEFSEPVALTAEVLALEVLAAGVARAGDVPVYIVNEPVYVSSGRNSDLRYNAWYPRWAYDSYRVVMAETAEANGWLYLDLWDAIPPDQFTDSPVHLTAAGEGELAERVGEWLEEEGRGLGD